MKQIHIGKLLAVIITLVSTLTIFNASPLIAFKPNIHEQITEEALGEIVVPDPLDGQPLSFSVKAIKEILEANKKTDTCPICQFKSSYHFDDESFAASNIRIWDLRKHVIKALTDDPIFPDGRLARERLGGLLHTLQDFYAHTNWIELGNFFPNPDLGTIKFDIPTRTVPACLSDMSTLNPELKVLTSGHFDVIDFLLLLGTVDDPRTPWDEVLIRRDAVCFPSKWKANGYCRHGYDIPYSSKDCPEGLNKDEDSRNNHQLAANIATEATKHFVQDIIDEILTNSNLKVDAKSRAIKALMSTLSSLVIVLDISSTMRPEMEKLKSSVRKLLEDYPINNQPLQFVLVTYWFDLPYKVYKTSIPKQFINYLDSVEDSGQWDCGGYRQEATLIAINHTPPDSAIWSFTDGEDYDPRLADAVQAAAKAKHIKIYDIFSEPYCEPTDDLLANYQSVQQRGFSNLSAPLASIGSQAITLKDANEIPKLFDMVQTYHEPDLEPILNVYDTITSTISKAFEIPIDSSVERLFVSAFVKSKQNISLFDPSGVEVTSSASVTVTQFGAGATFVVDRPQQRGIWKLQTNGIGPLSISAEVVSPIKLLDFQFITEQKASVHGGYDEINGNPLISTTVLAEIYPSGPISTTNLSYVDLNNVPIASIALTVPFTSSSPDSPFYIGSSQLPGQPSQVAMTGIDSNGYKYQRTLPAIFEPSNVKITLSEVDTELIYPGVTATVWYTIENVGTDGTFQVQVSGSGFTVLGADPKVTLKSGQKQMISIKLRPLGLVADQEDALLAAVVRRESDPTDSNFTVNYVPVGHQAFLPITRK